MADDIRTGKAEKLLDVKERYIFLRYHWSLSKTE